MTIATDKTSITPEELLALPNEKDYELVDGKLVEKHMGSESSAVAMAIGILLGNFIKSKKLGHLFMADCGYRCFANAPNKIRRPDVSFVRRGRLPEERLPEGYLRIAPDFVVEVLSPGDTAYEIDEKVAEYLEAGVKLVWVVNPKTRSVRIHRAAGAEQGGIGAAGEADSISGEDVVPGFTARVAEFFDI
jgi:Uma2 family endonuclease